MSYSYDGATWYASNGTKVFEGGGCNTIAWNGVLWVAVGNGPNRVAYSSDGINWTGSASGNSIFPNDSRGVAWNGSMWVAGGNNGAESNNLAYSYDGINWIASASGTSVFTETVFTVAWNGYMWVAGGANGTNKLGYSLNGIDWFASESGNSLFTNRVEVVAWNGTVWVAGGAGTNSLAYSYDGITWNASSSGNSIFNSSCNSVAWNGSLWVAAGGGGTDCLAYSSDGINWTGCGAASNTLLMGATSVAWNGSVWVAGGAADTTGISTDGINWSYSISGTSLQRRNQMIMKAYTARIILPDIGTDTFGGTKVNAGFGPPTNNYGRIGDFYIDLRNNVMYGPKMNYEWDFGNCSGAYNTTTTVLTMNVAWNAVPGAQSYKIFRTSSHHATVLPIVNDPDTVIEASTSGVLLSAVSGVLTGLSTTLTTSTFTSSQIVRLVIYAYSDNSATNRITAFPAYCLAFNNGSRGGYATPATLFLEPTGYYDGTSAYKNLTDNTNDVIASVPVSIYSKRLTVTS